jgi:hypothetical protein
VGRAEGRPGRAGCEEWRGESAKEKKKVFFLKFGSWVMFQTIPDVSDREEGEE